MNKIKEKREQLNLTREELCKTFDIPYRTLQSWEIGDRKPPKYVEKLLLNAMENIKKKRS